VPLDHILARRWKDLLVSSGIDAQIISSYGGLEDIVLRWGEAIPIWYLKKYITNGMYNIGTALYISAVFYFHLCAAPIHCFSSIALVTFKAAGV